MRRDGSRADSSALRATRARDARHTGTSMMNSDLQPAASVTNPPATGPSASPR